MKIQFNTANNVSGSEALSTKFSETIEQALSRFNERITRVEVHFTDENGHKSGTDDKRCMLEARLEGLQPIAVTNNAATLEQALTGAITKLKTSLDTTLGKMRNY